MSLCIGVTSLTALFWLGVLAFRNAAVTETAWIALYAVCAAAAIVTWKREGSSVKPRLWLAIAFYTAFLALFFFAAHEALDVLYGSHRHRSHPEDHIGGLEVWFVMVPGGLSVALASLLRWAYLAHRRRRGGDSTPGGQLKT